MQLSNYYQPADNSGFGFHGSPNDSTGDTVWIQQWIAERAKEMHASWLKCLDLSVTSAQAIRNAGLEPINRPYIKTPGGSDGLGGYLNQCELLIRAGFRWQEAPWNEVNLSREMGYWPDPRRIAELWLPWARYITKIGGYASTPALAPGGEYEKDNGGDLVFARRFIERVNEIDPTIWDAAIWIAFHNYTLNHPPEYDRDQCSFQGWRFVRDLWYEQIGRRLPMLSTEGGVEVEEHSDKSLPAVTREQHRGWSAAISAAPVPPDVFCKVAHWLLTADGNVGWLQAGWYENMQPRLTDSIEEMKKLVIVKPEEAPPLLNYSPGRSESVKRIIIHHTGLTAKGVPEAENIKSYFESTAGTANPVSCHAIIGWGGDVVRYISTDSTAWHAAGANADTIGIELCGDGNQHQFSNEQYQALAALIHEYAGKYSILLDRQHILGHSEVTPGKVDPGSMFYFDRLFALLEGSVDVLKQPTPDGWQQYGATVEEALQTLKGISDLHADNMAYLRDLFAAAIGGLPLRPKE